MQAAGDSDHISEKMRKLRFSSDIAHLLTPPQSEEKFIQTTISSQKSSSSHSDHDQATNSNSYIESLKEERDQLSSYTDGLTHVFNLIDKEIDRVTGNDQPIAAKGSVTEGPHVLSEILPVPVDLYPNYNFVGRILGPRGTTAKQLENATGCKIIVHGRKRDATIIGNEGATTPPNDEPLRIEISCPANMPNAAQKLEIGANVIKALLVPPADGQDELKRQQLMVLANMNGTYRPRSGAAIAAATATASGDYQFQNLLPFGYRLPVSANCQQDKSTSPFFNLNAQSAYPDCSNPKCSVLRSLIENNVPLSNNFMQRQTQYNYPTPQQPLKNVFNSISNFEEVLNVMQWYEMMNRLRLPTFSLENAKANEISNRMCSSMKQFSGNRTSKRNYQRK